MAYYLTIKDKQNYKLLDVTSITEFKRLSKFKNNSYSLEEIDIFTSNFNNEIEFKRRLLEKSIITNEDIHKKIEIRIKLNGKLIKVRYDLVYRPIKKYLDIQYLKSELLIFQNDRTFLEKLLDYYRKSPKQEGLRQINTLMNGCSERDINMYSALSQFFKDELFIEDYKTGEVHLKYKSLHDLAMFIYNYSKSKEISLTNTNQSEQIKKELDNLKKEITLYKTEIKVMKKVKKPRKEIDGQTSFFWYKDRIFLSFSNAKTY